MRQSKYRSSTAKIEYKGQVYEVWANWQDESFAHDFGTCVQGHWEPVAIENERGVDVAGSLSDADFEALVLKYNREVEAY